MPQTTARPSVRAKRGQSGGGRRAVAGMAAERRLAEYAP